LFNTLGGCPRIGILFKIEEFSKNKHRHTFDIPRINFSQQQKVRKRRPFMDRHYLIADEPHKEKRFAMD